MVYSNGDQAASSASEAAGTVALVDTMNAAASGMVESSADQAGYAPNKRRSTDTTAIAAIDPRLKTIVDRMVGQMQSTSAKTAANKARMKMNMATQVNLSTNCSSTGTFSVSGTSNSDDASRAYDEATVVITFNDCRDSGDWTEMDGTIELYSKITPSAPAMLTSAISNVTANNLTFKQYSAGSFTTVAETGVINGTFNSTYDVTSASAYSNGSFNFTNHMTAESGEFFFNNLTSNWSTSSDSGATTEEVTINGSFGFSFTAGQNSISLTIGLSNLEFRERTNADATVDKWLNGTLSVVWNPLVCASGTITFTTADATPLHYSSISDTCPDTGTLQVNNAAIVFGTTIYVTVNGVTYPYASCVAMEAAGDGMCM
jgi:hypothetical protein